MNNFWQRTITGFLVVTAIIVGLWWHPLAYMTIFASVVMLGMYEFIRMIEGLETKVRVFWAFAIGLFVYFSSFLIFYAHIQSRWLIIIVPLVGGVFVSELYFKNKNSLLNIATTLIVPLYVALPFAFLHHLAFWSGDYSYKLLLGFFLMIWGNDSGAYLVGSLIGRKKLFPSVSPAKSWEGAIGGLVFAFGIAAFNFYVIDALSLVDWIVIGAIVSVLGTYGDLIESMLKRSVNIKDSGSMLPGHGGILDRFDAVFFSAPAVSCYLLFC
ncbi:phosphatidate cytidylyltransferase [Marinilabilia rubra]|uniref:Phosphatidate cytidylyltransferase n=1 Tax=Marinilabilia rubra TaxID=2162893 RepID=A0A2U2BDQ9_9BACT|nr:phosphatidate cytidylyltransferase [Marinilabilia rubra]PWE01167.1 phosphatidate cytidylyltransferase [Marinilabilia rubra]